tara:strand:+ start:365 stop:562 length:198 start_codon:yes stop_codon:yes gene_type:complete
MSDECRAELMTKIKEISLRPEPVYIDSDNEELELDLKEQQLVVRLNQVLSNNAVNHRMSGGFWRR